MTDYARSDVYPPEVEAIGDMTGCTDARHVFGCPCGYGGDAELLVTLPPSCVLCHRSDPIKYGTYVRVSWPDGSIATVCDDCVEKGDVVETLDMTEGDDDDG